MRRGVDFAAPWHSHGDLRAYAAAAGARYFSSSYGAPVPRRAANNQSYGGHALNLMKGVLLLDDIKFGKMRKYGMKRKALSWNTQNEKAWHIITCSSAYRLRLWQRRRFLWEATGVILWYGTSREYCSMANALVVIITRGMILKRSCHLSFGGDKSINAIITNGPALIDMIDERLW